MKQSQLFLMVVVFILIASFFTYSVILNPVSHLKSESNQKLLTTIIQEIIDPAMDNETKTKAILEWFDSSQGNIFNDYQLFKQGKLLYQVPDGLVQLYTSPPYIAVRCFNDKDSLWILTTQFGHCGEYALIFRDLADEAGLNVRRVKCAGEDHEWNEVFIDDEWVIVDPTAVHLPDRKGYNLSWDFMEKKVAGDLQTSTGNVTYIYGEYPNGTKVDITHRYSNVTTVNVQVIDSNGNPSIDIRVWIVSNNRNDPRDTLLRNSTNENGFCSFIVGGGNITMKAKSGDFIPEYGEKTFTYNETAVHNITIKTNIDWTKNEILLFTVLSISLLLIWSSIYYIYKKMRKDH
jgi:hypothetical protein